MGLDCILVLICNDTEDDGHDDEARISFECLKDGQDGIEVFAIILSKCTADFLTFIHLQKASSRWSTPEESCILRVLGNFHDVTGA